MRTTVIAGPELKRGPYRAEDAAIRIVNEEGLCFSMSREELSRSLLAVGSPGVGKSVGLLQIAGELRDAASDRDVFVFFDTKGDYAHRLGRPRDVVLSYGENATVAWNIFEEIMAEGVSDDAVYDNAYEIATMLFSEKIQNAQNPFFPKNGRDIVMGLLYALTMRRVSGTDRTQSLDNRALAEFFRKKFTVNEIAQALRQFERTEGLITSFSNGGSGAVMTPQSQGVLAEAAEVGREIFKGSFARGGDFSIRRFVRERGGRALFVEYDLAKGYTLLPIYRTLCDMVLKEALSRGSGEQQGRVYVFMDEMRLLPGLQYLENAINFGRGMGLTVIGGIQNSSQIAQVYGDAAMRSILDSFGTMLVFNTSNGETRRLIEERIGKHVRMENVMDTRARMSEQQRISSVVEDWDITLLKKGQAIVHTVGSHPYLFQFPNR